MCDFNQLMNPVDCFLGKKKSERIKKVFVFFSICHLDEIFFFPFYRHFTSKTMFKMFAECFILKKK